MCLYVGHDRYVDRYIACMYATQIDVCMFNSKAGSVYGRSEKTIMKKERK